MRISREEVNKNNRVTNIKAARIASGYPAIIDLLGAIATSLVVWVGGMAVINEDSSQVITPGVFIAFLLYIDRFFDPIRDLSRRFDSFQSTMAAGERIIGLLDTPIEIKDEPDAIEIPPIRGEVCFENVARPRDLRREQRVPRPARRTRRRESLSVAPSRGAPRGRPPTRGLGAA